MTEFEVATERIGNGTTVVTVRGEVDLETAPEFDRHLQAALGSGASAVIVDLTPCEFFDSSGLNVLARANHRHDGLLTLALVAPHESIPRRTIEITQFDNLFRLYAERDAALTAAANHVNANAEGDIDGS